MSISSTSISVSMLSICAHTESLAADWLQNDVLQEDNFKTHILLHFSQAKYKHRLLGKRLPRSNMR